VTINPEIFQLAIDTLSQVLRQHADPQSRAKAAECLGQLGSTDTVPTLCKILLQEQNRNVRLRIMDAIVDLAQSQSSKPMTETPKYDLRGANIGNFAETIQSGGRQEATQHIYAPEQDFDKLLTDYQQFFNDLQQKYPIQIPEAALLPIINAEFQEIQKTQPQRWQNFLNLKRLWNGGKKATFKMGEHFTEESLWGKMAIAFLEGILEED
jgi:HEAT repeats